MNFVKNKFDKIKITVIFNLLLHYYLAMFQRFLLVSVLVSASLFSLDAFAAPGRSVTIAQINCNGTAVVRTEVGKLEVITISPNMDGCVGPRATTESSVVVTSTGTQSISPAPVVETPSSGSATGSTTDTQKPKFDRANGPLLDLTSKEVGEYKIAKMKEQGIRYANPVRSVRVRQAATKNSTTTTYLMKNDAVVQSGTGSGWTPVQ